MSFVVNIWGFFFKIIVFLFFGTEFETIRKQTNAKWKSFGGKKGGGGKKRHCASEYFQRDNSKSICINICIIIFHRNQNLLCCWFQKQTWNCGLREEKKKPNKTVQSDRGPRAVAGASPSEVIPSSQGTCHGANDLWPPTHRVTRSKGQRSTWTYCMVATGRPLKRWESLGNQSQITFNGRWIQKRRNLRFLSAIRTYLAIVVELTKLTLGQLDRTEIIGLLAPIAFF